MSLRSVSAVTFALFGALAMIPTSGCVVTSETQPTPGPTYKYPDEASFCNAVAAAECNDVVVKACFDVTGAANTQKCVADRSPLSVCNPGGLPYHPADAGTAACLAAYATVFATGSWSRSQLDSITKACITTFSKGGGANAACSADTDCDAANGLSCVVHAGVGTCQKPNPVNGGEKCLNPADQCPAKQYCDATNHCIAMPSAGDACGAAAPCDSTSKCDLVKKVCVAGLADQSACTADDECAGTFCYKGNGMTTGKCLSIYKLDSLSSNCDPFTT